MTDNVFDKQTLTIPCPSCGKQFKKPIKWIKKNKHLICDCGATINLESDQFLGEIKKAEKALSELKRDISRMQ